MTILKDSDPIARKQHHCALCCESILPGERHHYQVNVLDDFNAIRACRFCWEFAMKHSTEDDWEAWAIGYFCSDLREHWRRKVEAP